MNIANESPDTKRSSRVKRRSGQDLLIGPGTRLIIEPVGAGRKIPTEYVGMLTGKCLIARLPTNSTDQVFLVSDALLTVKYARDGHHVTAFHTAVQGSTMRPVGLLFLDIPKSIESIDLRQTDRMQCFLPNTVFVDGNSSQGLILDLSVGGCKLAIAAPGEIGTSQVKADAEIVINFNLFDTMAPMFASGVVRNVSDTGLIGIQFHSLASDVEEGIQDYIDKARQYLLR